MFGSSVALCALVFTPELGRKVVRIPIALMHSQLVLVAIALWLGGEVVAPYALLGFALVGGFGLALYTANANAGGKGPSLCWYVRWGGMVVAGVAAWMELQHLDDVAFGMGLHVAFVSALALAVLARPRHARESS